MKKILLTSLLALGVGVSAQVTGTKTIGTDYPTLADAFTDLNNNGVGSGGVTINIPAGYTETAPVGGYLLGTTTLNATLSASNPIVIQKAGSGANPLFTAYVGTSATVDAIFKFSGVDYTTIDGIDLTDSSSNITAATMMERGFAFYNLSTTDGSNYNTIKNSSITLSTAATTQTIGIYFAHTDSLGTAIVPASIDGTNSYNKVYSNQIINPLSMGVALLGYNTTTAPYALYDQNNDIGGSTSATGNTFTNLGLLGYVTSYGVVAQYQNNTNVSNNTISYAAGLGSIGIYLLGTNSVFTANNNTVNATNRQTYYTTSATSGHYGIASLSAGASLTANNNIINIAAPTAYTGSTIPAVYGILQGGTGAGSFTADSNTINGGGSVGSAYGIYSSSTATVNITNNNVNGFTTSSVLSSSTPYGIYLAATGTTGNILRNKIYNLTSNGSAGLAHGIYVAGSTASTTTNIVNNLISGLSIPSSSSTSVGLSGIYLASTGATSNLNVYYNTVYLSTTSSGANFSSAAIYHTNNATATTAALDLRNNILVNTSTPKGTGYASAFRRSAAAVANYATTSNNNEFYAGTGTNQNIYYNGTNAYTTLSAFQTFVASRETNSLSENPSFTSTIGTDANFLKLNVNATTTQALDNKGASIAGYTTDFAGATRNATTPDVGAYEFTYVAPTVAPDCTTLSSPANESTGSTPNPATLSWASASGATSYKLYLGTTSGGTDILNGVVVNALTYSTTLAANTKYYAKVIASNNIGDATGCTETTFTTGNVVYCSPTSTSVTYEYITNVNFAGIDNTTTGNLGLNNYTSQVGTVTRGEGKTLSVTIKADSNDYLAAFIDWNQNGVLNDTGEVYVLATATSANGPHTITVTPPSDAKLGNTRMRVLLDYSSSSQTLTPCQAVDFGEIEDYTIDVKDVTMAASDINKTNISIFPNPFKDVLKISDVKGVKSISVNDMSGRQVKSLAPSAEINLSNLKEGLYIVNLQMEDGSVKSFKAIKK